MTRTCLSAYLLELVSASTRDGIVSVRLARALELALDALSEPETSRWMGFADAAPTGVEPDPIIAVAAEPGSIEGALDRKVKDSSSWGARTLERHSSTVSARSVTDLSETVVPTGGSSDHQLWRVAQALRLQIGVLKSAKSRRSTPSPRFSVRTCCFGVFIASQAKHIPLLTIARHRHLLHMNGIEIRVS